MHLQREISPMTVLHHRKSWPKCTMLSHFIGGSYICRLWTVALDDAPFIESIRSTEQCNILCKHACLFQWTRPERCIAHSLWGCRTSTTQRGMYHITTQCKLLDIFTSIHKTERKLDQVAAEFYMFRWIQKLSCFHY